MTKGQVADEALSEVERERRRHAGQLDADKGRRSSAANVAAEADRLLIVGAPGQGKSTLLRHLLLDATERWLVDPLNAPFPCLVRLSQWSDAGGPPQGRLSRYLTEHLPGFAEISKDAAAAWYAGKMLWLLDGIDEIRGGAAREHFQEELVRLAAPGTRHRFVVSTRPAGEPRGGLGTEWLRTELPALAEPQVLIALRNWSRVLREKDDLRLDAVDFAAKLATNPGLRQVRGNALLLTMAVLFFKQRKRLPNDRWEFYNGAEQSLRDSWARHRLNDRDAASLPGDYAANVLETLALDGMLEGRVLFTHEQVATAVRSVLTQRNYTGGEQDAEIPRFIDAARDAIGVFVEQASGRFGFVHLTFQEFLAARALIKRGEDTPKIIEQFWDHPDWHETWLLYALGCQSLQGRFGSLLDVVLQPKLRDPLDRVLRRQERFVLRMAGVGMERLPTAAEFGLAWARKSISSASVNHLSMTLDILAAWERPLPQDIQDLLIRRLQLSDFTDREWAIRALAAQANNIAVRAALVRAQKDRSSHVRTSTVRALAALANDPAVLSIILAACADRSAMVRSAATVALGAYAEYRAVQTALIKSTKDRIGEVRHAAVLALAPWVADPTVLKALVDLARDNYPYIRREALSTVRNWAGNQGVRDILVDMARNSGAVYRRIALQALAQRADDPVVMNLLVASTTDRLSIIRQTAIEVLGSGVHDSRARLTLIAATQDKAITVRAPAIYGLAAFRDGENVLAPILNASHDRHWSVREAVASALAQYPCDATVCASLGRLLEDERGSVREAASISLSQHVNVGSARDFLLRAISRSEDLWISGQAFEGLGRYAHDPKIRIALLHALKHSIGLHQTTIIRALAPSLDHSDVVKALLHIANTGEDWVRVTAMETLLPAAGRNQELRNQLLTVILTSLKDGILFGMGSGSRVLASRTDNQAVRTELITALQSNNWHVRAGAAQALANVTSDETVQGALIAACDDIFDQVRRPAMSALEYSLVRRKFARTPSS